MVSTLRQIVYLFVIVTLTLLCACSHSGRKTKRNIPVELHNGDIAFRRGEGIASRAVLMTNARGSFSHVGVVLNIDNQWFVVHEVPFESESLEEDKICCESAEIFFGEAKAASGALYRFQGADSLMVSGVYKYVMRQVERELPFDHDYDLSDSTKQYCSEMVWRSYMSQGVDLSQGRRTKVTMPGFAGVHIMPADIEMDERLELLFRF